MDSVITVVTSVFTAGISWVGSVASTVADEPILLFYCVGVPGMYLGVRLFRSLLHANG